MQCINPPATVGKRVTVCSRFPATVGERVTVCTGGLKARNQSAQGAALWHAIDGRPKPHRGVTRLISFDYAPSGLDEYGGFPIRRALPCANDYALSGLDVRGTFVPLGYSAIIYHFVMNQALE
jgi:hypothetical protein